MERRVTRLPVLEIGYVDSDKVPGVWTVAPTAKVTIDGQDASVHDIVVGDLVEFSGQPATGISVTRAPKSPERLEIEAKERVIADLQAERLASAQAPPVEPQPAPEQPAPGQPQPQPEQPQPEQQAPEEKFGRRRR